MPVLTTKAQAQWADAIKAAKGKKPPKHRNVRCQDKDGRWFDSKRERENHLALEKEHGARNVRRQVRLMYHDGEHPLYMYVDHAVNISFGRFGRGAWIYYDTKGRITQSWKNKAKMLKDNYGIEIEILT